MAKREAYVTLFDPSSSLPCSNIQQALETFDEITEDLDPDLFEDALNSFQIRR